MDIPRTVISLLAKFLVKIGKQNLHSILSSGSFYRHLVFKSLLLLIMSSRPSVRFGTFVLYVII